MNSSRKASKSDGEEMIAQAAKAAVEMLDVSPVSGGSLLDGRRRSRV